MAKVTIKPEELTHLTKEKDLTDFLDAKLDESTDLVELPELSGGVQNALLSRILMRTLWTEMWITSGNEVYDKAVGYFGGNIEGTPEKYRVVRVPKSSKSEASLSYL